MSRNPTSSLSLHPINSNKLIELRESPAHPSRNKFIIIIALLFACVFAAIRIGLLVPPKGHRQMCI